MSSTHSAPSKRGKGGAAGTKGGRLLSAGNTFGAHSFSNSITLAVVILSTISQTIANLFSISSLVKRSTIYPFSFNFPLRHSSFCHPYRCVPPLEMTPPPSFRPQRSGVEKSHAETWHAPWWQEISRLYVSIEPKVFATIPEGSSARDDDAGRQHTVIPGIKLTRTLPRTLRHFDESEAKQRNLTPKCGTPHGGRRSLDSAFH